MEYLLVVVDASTLMDFLENEDGNWEFKKCQWKEQFLSTEPLIYIPRSNFGPNVWLRQSFLKYRFVIHVMRTFAVCVWCVWGFKHLGKNAIVLQYCFNCLIIGIDLYLAKHTFFFKAVRHAVMKAEGGGQCFVQNLIRKWQVNNK